MATQKYCRVVVSWPVDDGGSVEDVVIYNIESDFEEGQMPSSTLDSLTDLFLSPPVTDSGDPGPPCKAQVAVRESGLTIAAVDVLSSARNVEVFSSTGEYLVLAEGTRLDVAGERKLFLSQHTFDQPQPTCDLKFVSLVDPQTLWLHSIHLTLAVDKTTPAFPLAMGPSIDMDKVNAIMADMDADVPDRAKGLMSTMTSMQKNKERALGNMFGGGGKGPPTMASIMGMFATMGVTSRMPPPVTPAPAASAESQSKQQQPKQQQQQQQQQAQGKAETTQNNSGSKGKKNKKGGKKGQKNGGGASGNAEVEMEEVAPPAKQEAQKQNQPKGRPNSGEQSSQPKGKKQKDNNKKDSEDFPRNESSNSGKKKSGSNSNNKNSANNTNSGSESSKKNSGSESSKNNSGSESSKKNSGSESSKKNSGSDSARSKKDQKGSSKEAKPQQPTAKDTKRSDSVDADSVESQSPVTQADLAALEQRLLQRIDKAEEAIVSEVTSRIEASEQRIVQHMESLVSKMAVAFLGGGNMMNGGGQMGGELTPD